MFAHYRLQKYMKNNAELLSTFIKNIYSGKGRLLFLFVSDRLLISDLFLCTTYKVSLRPPSLLRRYHDLGVISPLTNPSQLISVTTLSSSMFMLLSLYFIFSFKFSLFLQFFRSLFLSFFLFYLHYRWIPLLGCFSYNIYPEASNGKSVSISLPLCFSPFPSHSAVRIFYQWSMSS